MTKVLITGANGLLGQKIVSEAKHFPQISLLLTSKGPKRFTDNLNPYFELDICDPIACSEFILHHKPDVIINTAAMTNVDLCESEKENCDNLNITAVKTLVKLSNKIDAHLIHLGTDFIFDGENGPYSEEDLPNPLSYYGMSKWKADLIVMANANSWAILRTIIIYGIAEGMSRGNLVLWAKNALEKEQEIKVVNDQFRSPTLAEDLAWACLRTAELKAKGVFHISGAETKSIFDLVNELADVYGLNKELIIATDSTTLNQAAKRPPNTGFNIQKAIDVLGYKPKSFAEGLLEVKRQLS